MMIGDGMMEKSIRVIATYLPQFHRVKENDEWWGEGFTEWTAVRNSRPLFEGHNQPRIPLHNNYYDLMDKSVMQWQADLAKKYLIDGFCFWHYWFENGKKILERPAENLLGWRDIDMPFCFCWANETWARTWSNIPNPNFWSTKFEPKQKYHDNGVLLRQNYGGEEQWKEHFNYLLPFFKDDRYIKYEGRPVFIIFRPYLVSCIIQMLQCWQDLAKKNGLKEIFLIGWGMPSTEMPYDANIVDILQNVETINYQAITGGNLKVVDYKKMWDSFLIRPIFRQRTEYLCGCVGYDTTPRNGTSGTMLCGATPKLFQQYFEQLVQRSVQNKNPFVFINAWNEWAEGNYLEPDETTKYGYLEGIRNVMSRQIDFCQNNNLREVTSNLLNYEKNTEIHMRKVNKYRSRYYVLYKWLSLKMKNESLEQFFVKRDYKKIAIYGWGDLGKLLATELKNTSIDVSYIIDRRGVELNSSSMKIYTPNEISLPSVDVIVVTVVDEFIIVYNDIKEIVKGKIISLDTILEEV